MMVENDEDEVKEKIKQILNDLSIQFDTAHIEAKYPPSFDIDCNNILLNSEVERLNNCTNIIKSSLKLLENALRGVAAFSDEVEKLYNNIKLSIIP